MQTAHSVKAAHHVILCHDSFICLLQKINLNKHILPPRLVVLREQLPVPQPSIVLALQVLPLSLPPKELFTDQKLPFLVTA